MYKVLLYYKYTKFEDPDDICNTQKALCKRLGLKGRILIAEEGINGTVAGSEEAVSEYQAETEKIQGLEDIEWKVDYLEKQPFPKMRVVVRDEIVTLGLKAKGKDADIRNKAEYIEPEELLKMYDNNEEFYIIDGRNEYEARIGKFKNAHVFDVKNFKEIPDKINEVAHLKEKPVVLYCTGGVRCEKLSAHFVEQGFKNVKHVHGGIHGYSKKAGGKYFEGTMYVFDGRIHTEVNTVNPTTISECHYCKTKIARFINCHNARCNLQFICCEECEKENNSTCSEDCKRIIEEHPEYIAYKKDRPYQCGCM